MVKILNLERRPPSKKYAALATLHYSLLYAAIKGAKAAGPITLITLYLCLQESGKQTQRDNWIKTIVDSKIQTDLVQDWLDQKNVEYSTPSFLRTILP